MTRTRNLFGLLLAFAVFGAGTAAAEEAFTLPADTSPSPAILSPDDAQRYREIFAAERAGNFEKSEKLFDAVTDTSLKGYVLAAHYLSPHSRPAGINALVDWLKSYGDLAVADRIYRLAVKRSTRKVRRHHRTILVAEVTNIPAPAPMPRVRGGGYEDVDLPDPPLESDAARAIQDRINAYIRSDSPDQAMSLLQTLNGGNLAPGSDIARLSQRIAASYFAEGMDRKAYDLAAGVADADRRSAPLLDWNAGLSAFRLGLFHEAAQHFEELAQVGSVPNWVRAAASFWAARAHMRAGEPNRVVTLLTIAASEQPTFYGLLAEQLLGKDTQSGFSEPVFDDSTFSQLMQLPAAHRAVALWQSGESEFVEKELTRSFGLIDARLDPAFAALAEKLGAYNLELRASETSASNGLLLTGLFPLPRYRPQGGYAIDPSLVLAIARAESRFHADAVSAAGARGLMQLMPGTAAHIAGGDAPAPLTDPEYNMTLGQRYLAELLDTYNGNLVELCAAYNAGIGKVSNWMAAREGKENDALLFIESMRSPETRLYVKRVLTYHWMYRRRLGLDAPTLTEAASGEWPIYKPALPAARSSVVPPRPANFPEDVNALASD
ncbi:MAG TPA: lytic transglycosylase domain-containing protein [Rhizomicrobium sp.]|nr:lytic transglycosylase domain-containing protein [Rhizomicrobium sp.]